MLSVGWSDGRSVGRLVGRSVGWSVGRADGRSVGRLVGRQEWLKFENRGLYVQEFLTAIFAQVFFSNCYTHGSIQA